MNALEIARRYVEAWNTRDTSRLAATFRTGGTYEDPNTNGPIGPEGLAEYAAGLFAAFPDLWFEEISIRDCGPDEVVVAWMMRGANRGSLRGLPPTGATIALPGVDLIAVRDGGVERVQGYFDRQSLLQQLGVQVNVQPHAAGPVRFGVCTQVRSASQAPPGAVTLTMIEAGSEAEVQQIRETSRRIMMQLAGMPGFLSFQGAVVGRRLTTVTLWENREAARQVMREGNHKEAAASMFAGAVGAAFHASHWTLDRLGEMWVRCGECGELRDARAAGDCPCGAIGGQRPAFW